jgi:hypothetical protein
MTGDEAVSADAVVEFVVEWVDKKLAPLDARLTELEAKLDAALSRLDADAAKVIDLPEAEWRRACSSTTTGKRCCARPRRRSRR